MGQDDICAPGTSRTALSTELTSAVNRLQRRLRSQRGDVEIGEGQIAVLMTLKHHGAMSPGALADHERVSAPAMTRSVNALTELGLVTKLEHPTDRRQVLVELTERGTTEVGTVRRRRDQWLSKQLRSLTPDERATLAAATELMTRIAHG
ncbi:MarR family transcriptional regulator [Flavimobilis sp. GY10621]|uniref:MarR family transcriptional regulator n=1 Tax=Flavimobilis rhizosphaerae TaxID=2775421 RepID=A0ABR9DLZ6_9MICO|nr:MarR family transcriptional regulator [Flavimobilis rhizosphaerae]MBD9698161.1 MarR family transcriptional regulator [Flavimobilis rhizosphaerae]